MDKRVRPLHDTDSPLTMDKLVFGDKIRYNVLFLSPRNML